ncbi:MAG: TRAP transporter small permease [Elioraea sp.]|nr:TRAP transporter small permease [Elioraea sp.]
MRSPRRRPGTASLPGLLARHFAVVGGVVLLAAALLTCASVLRRWLDGRAIRGDFELVSLASAIALFTAFAFAASRGANVAVTSFTTWLPGRVQRVIDALWLLLWAGVCFVLAERLFVTASELHRTGTVTMALGMSTWWVAGIGSAAFALAGLAALVRPFAASHDPRH